MTAGALHHVELWVPDLAGAVGPWGWLLDELGWTPYQDWPGGKSWRHEDTYLVLEQSPALSSSVHDRLAPGLNHLAFQVSGPQEVDRLTEQAQENGWSLMFSERHPHAGGPETYGAYLEDNWGYEVELSAGQP